MKNVLIRIENGEAAFEISNLKYIDTEDVKVHFTFDISYIAHQCLFKTTFSELYHLQLFELKTEGQLVDENNHKKRLYFKKNEICLQLEQSDELVKIQTSFCLKTDTSKIADFLLEIKENLY